MTSSLCLEYPAIYDNEHRHLEREVIIVKKDKSIIMHKASHQGRCKGKPLIYFNSQQFVYTEDRGTTFEVVYKERTLSVSTVCDGHGGYMTSYIVTDAIPELFPACLEICLGDIRNALDRLFAELTIYIMSVANIIGNSGTTCNVTIFDPENEKVYIASLGDSPTLRYRKGDNGDYYLAWKSDDQDCSDQEEIERMVKIHRDNGDENAVASDVVFQAILKGKETGVWRNRWTRCMTHSSFGDLKNNYYPGIVNTKPRIYVQKWTNRQVSDIWIQCTDGLFDGLNHLSIGIQPRQDIRLGEIARHLDLCHRGDNVANSLHQMQIDSILKEKIDKYPSRPDSIRSWIESNIDNHLTKVFMW